MEIRGTARNISTLKRVKTMFTNVDFTIDKNEIPVLIEKTDEGMLKPFLSGKKIIADFLEYGYNRIRKHCPMKNRKCIGEKCAWYLIHNYTGDCGIYWTAWKGVIDGTRK